MSFKGDINDISWLSSTFNSISSLIYEGILQINNDGIRLVASDKAMIAVVDLFIDKSAFEKYELEKELKVGFNLSDLAQIFRRFSGKVKITIDENQLIVESSEREKKLNQRAIVLQESSIPPVETLDYKGVCEVTVDILKDAIDDSKLFGDVMSFELSENSLILSSELTGKGKAINKLPKGTKDLLAVESEGKMKSGFSIGTLSPMIHPISQTVKIKMGNEFPMRLEYETEILKLAWVIAPRVA